MQLAAELHRLKQSAGHLAQEGLGPDAETTSHHRAVGCIVAINLP